MDVLFDNAATELEQRAAEDALKFGMFRRGQNVVAGVSGGADSVALLHLLSRSEAFAPLELKVTVCHVNHNLRGEESDRDERFVREFCAELGVPFRLLSIDAAALARESGRSVEERSREERYRFFDETARELGGAAVATAHTLDDSLETFFINLARGTGSAGLAGIPPVRGNIVRPMIGCSRAQIEEYCRFYGLDYITDSTNLTDDYTRNRVRHSVIPALRSALPGIDAGFRRMTGLVREDAEYIEAQAQELLASAFRDGGYDVRTLSGAPKAVLGRAMLSLLSQNGAETSERKVRELYGLLEGRINSAEPVGGVYFRRRGELIRIERRYVPEPYFERVLSVRDFESGVQFRLNSRYCVKLYTVSRECYKNLKKVNPLLYYNCVDCDKINSNVQIRQRLPGDAIRLGGMTRTLKKLFNQKNIPLERRDTIPCAADGSGIVWVYGFGCGDNAAVDADSEHIGVFEIWEETEIEDGK